MASLPSIKAIKATAGHGSGGRLTQQLTRRILAHFETPAPQGEQAPAFQHTFQMEDCAFIGGDMAVSTDGFTVFPHDFPGGNIGKLAVCGSANDLAVRGVRPLFLTLALIIEEGLDLDDLDRYMESAAETAREGGIELVAGDTKVVPHGAADKLFVTTCAIGKKESPHTLQTSNLREGDLLILSTSPGRHGAALAAARVGLGAPGLLSDCALLWPALSPLLPFPELRCMRDCTRGGLGTVLCEWAEASSLGVEIVETNIPSHPSVDSVCDILGLDSLYLASEGCALIAVAPERGEECLASLRQNPTCRDAAIIGRAVSAHPALVGMKTQIGGLRFVDMPTGEILPRIC
ncbi:MAG: hydrogenase expression/formation protein HypE [Synergistaceae bacterium]|jgi:hydrogenase expression/formation protein HypE|nr:hydrogenase expression/formation protein HypE [Synergistaceae bacterium]